MCRLILPVSGERDNKKKDDNTKRNFFIDKLLIFPVFNIEEELF